MKKRIQKSPLLTILWWTTLAFLAIAGSFGVATVHTRHKIAATAAESRAIDRRLVEAERINARLTGEIAIATSPARLKELNIALNLGLRPPIERQIVRVTAEAQERFAAFRWNQLVTISEPTTFAFSPPGQN